MRGRNGACHPRPSSIVLLLLAGLAVVVGGSARALAQEATPAGSPAASPVPIASPTARSADCAAPLGLEPGSACLVVVHAVAGAPDVDLYVDDEVAIEGLAFGTASTYLGLPAGEHEIRVTEAGAAPDEALLDLPLTLEAGFAYEVAALAADDGVTAAILSGNLDPLADDRARIRVFQAIADAPTAEVALAGGETILPNVEAGSATGYAEVPAGQTPVDLEVRAAGGVVTFPIPGATLEPGLAYTFYAVGDVADPASLRVVTVAAPTTGSAQAGSTPTAADPIPLTPGTPAPATPTA
jgi:hypothetical protein